MTQDITTQRRCQVAGKEVLITADTNHRLSLEFAIASTNGFSDDLRDTFLTALQDRMAMHIHADQIFDNTRGALTKYSRQGEREELHLRKLVGTSKDNLRVFELAVCRNNSRTPSYVCNFEKKQDTGRFYRLNAGCQRY